jgi:propionyl-CoA carboxylase alpha chain
MLILLKNAKNDIIFIGPKSKAIKIMGSKLAAKDAVKRFIQWSQIRPAITDVEKQKLLRKLVFNTY